MKSILQLRSGKRAPRKVERSPNLPKDFPEAPELNYLPDQFEDGELSRLPPALNYFQNILKLSREPSPCKDRKIRARSTAEPLCRPTKSGDDQIGAAEKFRH
jgi:hypothetical protein